MLDVVVPRRGTRNQVWTFEGIVPGFNNSSESKITGCNPVVDACRLVTDRTRIEHTEVDGRCQRYKFDWA